MVDKHGTTSYVAEKTLVRRNVKRSYALETSLALGYGLEKERHKRNSENLRDAKRKMCIGVLVRSQLTGMP